MGTSEVERGPTSERLRRNVAELRKGRYSVRDLSERLGEAGRPLVASAVSKIEAGQRRVDVDDLVALAVALGVNPSRLLLPPAADDREVKITPAVAVPGWVAWRWADGRSPLPRRADATTATTSVEDLAEFQRRARPAGLPADAATADLVNELTLRLARLRQAVESRDRGEVDPLVEKTGTDPARDMAKRADLVRHAMRRLAAEVDYLLAQAEGDDDGRL